ncbi:class I SAM-dependent methyltransferase [Francisella uliginis]|uniref:Methyltransferase domain-containing protein n=1 Tax=Francisella uliginis TaxID=573570 RepID=A0A1L4BTA1_9GAMM|nr:class I SAM-dependent methyltransferase [Francisella uliginis]API87072.1 hypothetical protein F7310_06770 [Francisella uliginis]
MDLKREKEYWDNFYKSKTLGIENIPSQFAAFVMSEYNYVNKVLEIGCGMGRDTFFFGSLHKKVLGLDASSNVIQLCNKKAKNKNIDVDFQEYDISSQDYEYLREWFNKENEAINMIYARFFLHAIDDELEKAFFKLCKSICRNNDLVALEFRTNRDESQSKETDLHYRRYISPLDFMNRVIKYGFKVDYFVEGFGYAKYKSDDAHVARFILRVDNE